VPISWDERMVDAFIARRRELSGVLLVLLALITLIALTGLAQAGWLSWWPRLLGQIFGWGAFVIGVAIAATGAHLLAGRLAQAYPVRPAQLFGFSILALVFMGLGHLAGGFTLRDAFAGRGGGLVGWAISEPMFDFLGPFLASLVYLALVAWAFMLIFGRTWDDVYRALMTSSARLAAWADRVDPDRIDVVGRADAARDGPALRAETAPNSS